MNDYTNTSLDIAKTGPRIAIWGIGGVFPQGVHLPVDAENVIVDAFARSLAEKIGNTYLLPTFPYGTFPAIGNQLGVVSLHPNTLAAIVEDVVEALYKQNIKTIIILNGFGIAQHPPFYPSINRIVKLIVRKCNYQYQDLFLLWVQIANVIDYTILQKIFNCSFETLKRELLSFILGENKATPNLGEKAFHYLLDVIFEYICTTLDKLKIVKNM